MAMRGVPSHTDKARDAPHEPHGWRCPRVGDAVEVFAACANGWVKAAVAEDADEQGLILVEFDVGSGSRLRQRLHPDCVRARTGCRGDAWHGDGGAVRYCAPITHHEAPEEDEELTETDPGGVPGEPRLPGDTILFIDEGVLHSSWHPTEDLMEVALTEVVRVRYETNALLVVSANWRNERTVQVRQRMNKKGCYVYKWTPDFGGDVFYRALEIKSFLDNNRHASWMVMGSIDYFKGAEISVHPPGRHSGQWLKVLPADFMKGHMFVVDQAPDKGLTQDRADEAIEKLLTQVNMYEECCRPEIHRMRHIEMDERAHQRAMEGFKKSTGHDFHQDLAIDMRYHSEPFAKGAYCYYGRAPNIEEQPQRILVKKKLDAQNLPGKAWREPEEKPEVQHRQRSSHEADQSHAPKDNPEVQRRRSSHEVHHRSSSKHVETHHRSSSRHAEAHHRSSSKVAEAQHRGSSKELRHSHSQAPPRTSTRAPDHAHSHAQAPPRTSTRAPDHAHSHAQDRPRSSAREPDRAHSHAQAPPAPHRAAGSDGTFLETSTDLNTTRSVHRSPKQKEVGGPSESLRALLVETLTESDKLIQEAAQAARRHAAKEALKPLPIRERTPRESQGDKVQKSAPPSKAPRESQGDKGQYSVLPPGAIDLGNGWALSGPPPIPPLINEYEAALEEAGRRDAERREAERREAERREGQRRKAERREAERREAEKREAERREAEKREVERREVERREAEKRAACDRELARRKAEKESIAAQKARERAGQIPIHGFEVYIPGFDAEMQEEPIPTCDLISGENIGFAVLGGEEDHEVKFEDIYPNVDRQKDKNKGNGVQGGGAGKIPRDLR